MYLIYSSNLLLTLKSTTICHLFVTMEKRLIAISNKNVKHNNWNALLLSFNFITLVWFLGLNIYTTIVWYKNKFKLWWLCSNLLFIKKSQILNMKELRISIYHVRINPQNWFILKSFIMLFIGIYTTNKLDKNSV